MAIGLRRFKEKNPGQKYPSGLAKIYRYRMKEQSKQAPSRPERKASPSTVTNVTPKRSAMPVKATLKSTSKRGAMPVKLTPKSSPAVKSRRKRLNSKRVKVKGYPSDSKTKSSSSSYPVKGGGTDMAYDMKFKTGSVSPSAPGPANKAAFGSKREYRQNAPKSYDIPKYLDPNSRGKAAPEKTAEQLLGLDKIRSGVTREDLGLMNRKTPAFGSIRSERNKTSVMLRNSGGMGTIRKDQGGAKKFKSPEGIDDMIDYYTSGMGSAEDHQRKGTTKESRDHAKKLIGATLGAGALAGGAAIAPKIKPFIRQVGDYRTLKKVMKKFPSRRDSAKRVAKEQMRKLKEGKKTMMGVGALSAGGAGIVLKKMYDNRKKKKK